MGTEVFSVRALGACHRFSLIAQNIGKAVLFTSFEQISNRFAAHIHLSTHNSPLEDLTRSK